MSTAPLTNLDDETIRAILKEYRIASADLQFRCDATAEELIDIVEGNRVYMPAIYVMNKIDQITVEELDLIDQIPNCVPISAHHRWNIDGLQDKIWEYLNLIRIYTKPKNQLTDFSEPVIMRRDKSALTDFCNRIHKTILAQFKYAYVWGNSVTHQPQKVGKDHVLLDEDIVQIVKKI